MEKYIKAGRISARIRNEVSERIKPGMKILDLAEFIEKRIFELGGKPAFPVNISINDIAAHYTPSIDDKKVINSGDLVKIDFGVHIDGYIADLAFTYCSEKNDLIETAKKALENGINVIKSGIKVFEISKAINEAVKNSGFGVIINLTGHGLNRFDLHSEPTIPNVINNSNYKLRSGDVIALEPFITKTNGYVKESDVVEIYSFLQDKPVRLPEARKILDIAKNEYVGLPFAKRWLLKNISPLKISLALKQLESIGALRAYPVLKERENKVIAQAEDTIIVDEKPIITTRL